MAVMKHLCVLENARRDLERTRGWFIHYNLVPDNVLNTLNGYLQEVCPVWRPLNRKARGDRQRARTTYSH